MQLASPGLVEGITRYKIPKLILLAVSQVSFSKNYWGLEVGYSWDSWSVGRYFGCSGSTDGFERGLSDCLRAYSG